MRVKNNSLFFVLIGVLIFTTLLIFANIFYLEKTVFLDISYYTVKIISQHKMLIDDYRFGSVVTKLFPFIGSKLHLSLNTILKWYSLGYVIYYFLVFIIIAFVFKNKMIALIQAGFYVWMCSDTFYWMQSHLQQGVSFLLLYFAALLYFITKEKWKYIIPISVIGLTTSIFFHPVIIFPVIFLLVYFSWIEEQIPRKSFWVLGSIILVIYYIKSIFFTPSYDSASMTGIENFIKLFPNYYTTSTINFFHYCFIDYGIWLIFSFILLGWMVIKKKYKAVVYCIVFTIGYTLIINVNWANGGNKFYLDNVYSLIGLFLAIVIFNSNKDLWLKSKLMLISISLITVFRLGVIYNTHTIYTNRLNWHKQVLSECKKNHIRKLSIPANERLDALLQLSWGVGYESILLSSLSSSESTISYLVVLANCSIIPYKNIEMDSFYMQLPEYMIATEKEVFNQNELSKEYFNLPEIGYKVN
jgi:hypothetical protein